MAKLKSELELQCPCCHALLVVDTNLGRIISHREPERSDKPELNEATRILADEARRRDARFEQSVEAEKTRGDALSRRFEEALDLCERSERGAVAAVAQALSRSARAVALAGLGRIDEAVPLAREAVEIMRRTTASCWKSFSPK